MVPVQEVSHRQEASTTPRINLRMKISVKLALTLVIMLQTLVYQDMMVVLSSLEKDFALTTDLSLRALIVSLNSDQSRGLLTELPREVNTPVQIISLESMVKLRLKKKRGRNLTPPVSLRNKVKTQLKTLQNSLQLKLVRP